MISNRSNPIMILLKLVFSLNDCAFFAFNIIVSSPSPPSTTMFLSNIGVFIFRVSLPPYKSMDDS